MWNRKLKWAHCRKVLNLTVKESRKILKFGGTKHTAQFLLQKWLLGNIGQKYAKVGTKVSLPSPILLNFLNLFHIFCLWLSVNKCLLMTCLCLLHTSLFWCGDEELVEYLRQNSMKLRWFLFYLVSCKHFLLLFAKLTYNFLFIFL